MNCGFLIKVNLLYVLVIEKRLSLVMIYQQAGHLILFQILVMHNFIFYI